MSHCIAAAIDEHQAMKSELQSSMQAASVLQLKESSGEAPRRSQTWEVQRPLRPLIKFI